jgi:hypothetical protein
MEFYKIDSPTTKQIFDAIIANEYTPLEKIRPKAKQIKVLLMNHFNTREVLVTFINVTNSGGFPIFMGASDSLYEIASEVFKDWYELSEADQENEIELLGAYMQTYDAIFNL